MGRMWFVLHVRMVIVPLEIVVCSACIHVRRVRRIKDRIIVQLAPFHTTLLQHYQLVHVLSTRFPTVCLTTPPTLPFVQPVQQVTNTTPLPTLATLIALQIVNNAHPPPTVHNA